MKIDDSDDVVTTQTVRIRKKKTTDTSNPAKPITPPRRPRKNWREITLGELVDEFFKAIGLVIVASIVLLYMITKSIDWIIRYFKIHR